MRNSDGSDGFHRGGTEIRTPDPLHAIGSKTVRPRSPQFILVAIAGKFIRLRSHRFAMIQHNC